MMTITVAMGTVPEEAGKASGTPECTVNTLFGTEAMAKENSERNTLDEQDGSADQHKR
jgi:hypothetical protein